MGGIQGGEAACIILCDGRAGLLRSGREVQPSSPGQHEVVGRGIGAELLGQVTRGWLPLLSVLLSSQAASCRV